MITPPSRVASDTTMPRRAPLETSTSKIWTVRALAATSLVNGPSLVHWEMARIRRRTGGISMDSASETCGMQDRVRLIQLSTIYHHFV